jgi:hypothetical protein
MKLNRVGDSVILLLSLTIIVLSFGGIADFTGKPEVHVRTEDGEFIYELEQDTFATFTGPVGETSIEIRDGKVHVHDSDCRNKVCIAAGWISSPGDWIICLPNNVFILVEGSLDSSEEGGTDDIAF